MGCLLPGARAVGHPYCHGTENILPSRLLQRSDPAVHLWLIRHGVRGIITSMASPRRTFRCRMIGHITFMSDQSMEEKFSRRLKNDKFSFGFDADFEVEGYLRYRGANFVKRFDANLIFILQKQ